MLDYLLANVDISFLFEIHIFEVVMLLRTVMSVSKITASSTKFQSVQVIQRVSTFAVRLVFQLLAEEGF